MNKKNRKKILLNKYNDNKEKIEHCNNNKLLINSSNISSINNISSISSSNIILEDNDNEVDIELDCIIISRNICIEK
jgi:hypothetical protein